MPWKYNPFTDALDQTGSGGASYINGVVADPTALPVTVGTPALDSVYLAKAGSGVWLINRKPAGLYCRVANNGNAADWTHLGAFPEVNADGNWELYNSADPTKELKFDLSGISTGTTRTITVPNKNVTLDDASDARTPTAHTHAASAITSGVLDNARINFAAPSAIGSTTPSTGAFTTLSASTSLTLGTSGILSGGTNTIEQRNTTSAQTFRIYNTVSGAADANFERGFMRWSSNVLQIGTEAGGTGSGSRSIAFQTGGVTRVTIAPEGTYLPTILFAGNAQIQAAFGSGIIRLVDNGGTGFDRLQLGGGTSSFPALKRSSTTLQVRLADDSAFAPFECAGLTLNGNLTASTRNIVTDATTGTRIGTATTQLLGFWNAAPSAQPAAVADATDAATVITQLNALLSRLRTIGIIAT